jgi:hypothetical protein
LRSSSIQRVVSAAMLIERGNSSHMPGVSLLGYPDLLLNNNLA